MDYKIERLFDGVVVKCEFSVSIGGVSYLVIYGTHVNGGFCCIPNHKWGCEMANPNEITYNSNKLIECGAETEIAKAIAKAIYVSTKIK